jgi:hypothetical protein
MIKDMGVDPFSDGAGFLTVDSAVAAQESVKVMMAEGQNIREPVSVCAMPFVVLCDGKAMVDHGTGEVHHKISRGTSPEFLRLTALDVGARQHLLPRGNDQGHGILGDKASPSAYKSVGAVLESS